jgi:hypothetical protein
VKNKSTNAKEQAASAFGRAGQAGLRRALKKKGVSLSDHQRRIGKKGLKARWGQKAK